MNGYRTGARPLGAALVAGMMWTGASAAQDTAAPQGVVNLTASATEEVDRDWIRISLSTTRDAPTADAVQAQLKQALDAALVEARKLAKPGEVEVRTGAFNVMPRDVANSTPVGWQGSAELVVEGRDLQAIGQLTGRISTLTIARVGYELSRELRARTEGAVRARAIALYQQQAADCTRQFGYASYVLREVSVTGADAVPVRPMVMAMAMKATRSGDDDALPIEPGKGTVTVSVSGSVQLSR